MSVARSERRMACRDCEGSGRLYTSGWDPDGFPCPACSYTTVRLIISDTGEVKEWAGDGVEDGYPWEATALQLALNLVPDLQDAIDRARVRGDAEIEVRFAPHHATAVDGTPQEETP